MRLERKMMIDVEGGTVPECMRILRHEAGHVVQLAYQLNRRRRWQQLFGRVSTRYPRLLPAEPGQQELRPASAAVVRAESPGRGFRRDVRGLAARRARTGASATRAGRRCKKLEYVDELMAEIAEQAAADDAPAAHRSAEPAQDTLAEHYEKKQALYAVDTPTTYDRDLHRLFSDDPRHRRSPAASTFLREVTARRSGRWLRSGPANTSSRWTPMLDDMIGRCRELKLRAVGPERQLRMDFIVLLTAKTVHSLYSP